MAGHSAWQMIEKAAMKALFAYYVASSMLGSILHGKPQCPFCMGHFLAFRPGGGLSPAFRKKQVIGGGYRRGLYCPSCLSKDRERLVYLFMKKKRLLEGKIRLLHFSPRPPIQNAISKLENIEYFPAHFNSGNPKERVNIECIGYPDNYFDAIICCHVLEHVENDRKAMSEVHRVLKKGGWAILQSPVSPVMNRTSEIRSLKPVERKERYGFFDHLRLYGMDYKKRLESAGFNVMLEKLDGKTAKRFCLNKKESVYFCRKQ